MAFEANEYGRSVAAPGLVLPDQPYSSVSRCAAEDFESEGGFPVFAIKGEDAKGYAKFPQVPDSSKDDGSTKDDPKGYFLGIGQRIVTRDEYPAGTPISVIVTGMAWVKVGGNVESGDDVAINASGAFVKADSSVTTLKNVSNAKFMTSATNGSYAVVALK